MRALQQGGIDIEAESKRAIPGSSSFTEQKYTDSTMWDKSGIYVALFQHRRVKTTAMNTIRRTQTIKRLDITLLTNQPIYE